MSRRYEYPNTRISIDDEPYEDNVLVEEPEAHAYSGFLEWAKLFTPNVDIAIKAADARVRVDIAAYDSAQCEVEIFGCTDLDAMRHIRRALGGGRWTKVYTDWNYTETREFSPNLSVEIGAYRSTVCKRVKVGTKLVTKPDPAALEALRETVKQVTVEEPVYEWQC